MCAPPRERASGPKASAFHSRQTPLSIRAVLFDYAGVISGSPQEALREFEQDLAYPPGSISKLLYGEDWELLETNQITLREYVQRLVPRSTAVLGRKLDPRAFLRFEEKPFAIRHAMVQRTLDLRRQGYRTALLANVVFEWRNVWRTGLPVAEMFDAIVESYAVGLRKPDPRIFPLACDALGVPPKAVALFDDIQANITVAQALGIQAILVHQDDPAEALRAMDSILSQ